MRESPSMSEPPKSLHISPVGENWEVESETGTLGQAETKQEAVEMAQELAPGEGVESIAVHGSDGQIQQQIALTRTKSPADGAQQ